MSRKMILGLSLACMTGLAVSGASAVPLPGNFLPNPGLDIAAPAGVDQVYGPNVVGDTNPRPLGWHRGNNDFGVQTAPQFNFYNTPGVGGGTPATAGTAGEGNAPAGSTNGFALEVNDSSASGSGEWFTDFNAIPTGVPIEFRFSWEYTNVHSTVRPENSDQFRVTVDWSNSPTLDLAPPYDPGGNNHGPDELIPAGSPDLNTWTVVDQILTPPAGTTAMRITVDSGGSSQATGQLWVEDLSAAAVPEPTSIAMLSSGLLLLVRRRRA